VQVQRRGGGRQQQERQEEGRPAGSASASPPGGGGSGSGIMELAAVSVSVQHAHQCCNVGVLVQSRHVLHVL